MQTLKLLTQLRICILAEEVHVIQDHVSWSPKDIVQGAQPIVCPDSSQRNLKNGTLNCIDELQLT